jgi:transcription elongation factor GreB
MSKAFTKEDDDAGFTLEAARPRSIAGPVTALGARLARDRPGFAALAAAPVGPAPRDPSVVAFGAEVRVRDGAGKERVVVIASVDEIGLVPHAATAASPFARALMGARAGDVVEVEGPRGLEEVTVERVEYPR